jgi:hypothetical protein
MSVVVCLVLQRFEPAVDACARAHASPSPPLKHASQALVRWGGALLELAHYRQGEEAVQYIEDVGGCLEGGVGGVEVTAVCMDALL